MDEEQTKPQLDLPQMAAALAMMLDGLRVLAETGGGYRKLLIEQGFGPAVADAVAGDWLRITQRKFNGGD